MKINGENTKFNALTLWAAPKGAGGEACWAAPRAGTKAALSGQADAGPHICNSSWKTEAIFHHEVPGITFQMVTHLIECKPLSQMAPTGFSERCTCPQIGFVFSPVPNKTLTTPT